jgi:hypothetical protein
MASWTRRDVLAGLAGASGTWMIGCGSDQDAASPAANSGGFAMPACELDPIVDSLLAERVDAFPVLKRWLLAGKSPDVLFAAALTVGARTTITERDLHDVSVVNAAYLMTKRVAPEQRLVPLFYAWSVQHRAVMAAIDASPPPLPPIEPAKVPSAADAEARLLTAFEAWDAGAAEAAVVALYAAGGRKAVLAPLMRFGMRNHHWVGHNTIWTAYAIRCMDALGWHCAPWVVRSLVRAMNVQRDKAKTTAFESSLRRLGDVPASFRDGVDDARAVPPLLDVLRTGDAKTCVDAVVAELAGGTSRRTIWTALAIVAVEMSVRHQEPAFGVHELDTLNALRHLQGLAPNRDLEVLALLQAAAWRPEFRAYNDGKSVKVDERLDAVTPAAGAPPTLPAVFESLGSDRVAALHQLKSFFDGGGTAEQVIAAWPDVIVRHAGPDQHHYKYHLALLEETEAALPEWRKTLLLGITLRGPSSRDSNWARYEAARAIIAELA